MSLGRHRRRMIRSERRGAGVIITSKAKPRGATQALTAATARQMVTMIIIIMVVVVVVIMMMRIDNMAWNSQHAVDADEDAAMTTTMIKKKITHSHALAHEHHVAAAHRLAKASSPLLRCKTG